MNNKLITNIILIYFAVISIVLLVQIASDNKEVKDPISEKIPLSDNLNDAVVLYNESPVMLVNSGQAIVDSNNSDLVPVVKNGEFYVPINFFKEAYGAVTSFNADKNTATIRLNNIAWVLDKNIGGSRLVDSYEENELKLENPIFFENSTVYISLEDFGSAFNKNVLVYQDNLAVISEAELDIEEQTQTLEQLKQQVNALPCIINSDKLRQLMGENAYGLPEINIDNFLKSSDKPEKIVENVIVNKQDYTYAVVDNYVYAVENGAVKIIDTSLTAQEPVTQLFMENTAKAYGVVINNDRLVTLAELEKDKNIYTSVLVYDITSRQQPQLLNEFQTCGIITDFRFKNENMLFISKTDADKLVENKGYKAPFYYNDGEQTELSFEDVRYMPKLKDKSYTTVFSLNLYDTTVKSYCVFGVGNDIYLDNNGKYFYISSKRTITDKADTCLWSFNMEEDISFNGKTYLTGFKDNKNLYTFNNHIFVLTEKNSKTAIYILDNSLNLLNEINSILFNIERFDFVKERIYLQDKNSNLMAVDINDVNACEQSSIFSVSKTAKLYPYKDNYFISIDGNMLSLLDMNDMNEIKTLSTVEIQGKVDENSLFILKDGASVGARIELSENTEASTGGVSSNPVNAQSVYSIDDNFNFSYVGNIFHTNEVNTEGVPIDNVAKVNNMYLTSSKDKILLSDEQLTPVFTIDK